MTSRVGVVGGGLAGLSAAVACADAGAHVTLFESRPRLGGATWSMQRDGLWFDNGQHIFLRCCDQYIAFLKRLGVMDRVALQERLEIPVLMPGRDTAWLRRNGWPAPFHLTTSLLRFSPISFGDRLGAARAALALRGLDLADRSLDDQSFGAWLRSHHQSEAAIARFWDLFVRATINIDIDHASLALAAKVFQTGLLEDAGGADIGTPRVPLTQLHAEPAARELGRLGAEIRTRARVETIECGHDGEPGVRVRGERIAFDAVIVATPHDVAARILPDQAQVDRTALVALGASPIVNLHVVYDRRVCDFAFAAGIDTPVEWVFDRTESSGLAATGDAGQCLAISLSAADDYVGQSRAQLRAIFEPELQRLLPASKRACIRSLFVTCERTATFRGEPGTARLRPSATTDARGVFLAGAWTDTGWPATMEGAVRSGNDAARAALQAIGMQRTRAPIAA